MLRVKETTKIGAFLDWGLDKDLLLPFREQPQRVEAGRSYLVRLYLDEKTGRIVASRRLSRFYTGDVRELVPNQEVKFTVWDKARLGWRVIIDDKYIGIIYDNELFRAVKPGDRFTGFVHCIREEENRADIRFRPTVSTASPPESRRSSTRSKTPAASCRSTRRAASKRFRPASVSANAYSNSHRHAVQGAEDRHHR